MRRASLLITVVLTILVPMALAGCNGQGSKNQQQAGDEHGHSEHDHHHHDHAEGPHGGHLLQLSGGDQKYQAEWLHDDETGEVTVVLLNEDGSGVQDPPAEVTIEIPGEEAPKTYTLPATDVVNEVPTTAAYAITDPTLVTALAIIVDGQEPILRATIGETPVSAKFEAHDHDHGH